jgi:hypothetical protein
VAFYRLMTVRELEEAEIMNDALLAFYRRRDPGLVYSIVPRDDLTYEPASWAKMCGGR